LSNGAMLNGLLAIGCGILMTASVNFAKKGNELKYWLPLLLGVPLFILCGFPHCIADAFYYLSCPYTILWNYKWIILVNYIFIVIGNFIGCNLYRVF
jgi:formate/nitrite transporter FocA (FNT family)